MKKIHILVVILLTFVNHISAQIDLSGSASYQLNIEGDMGRRSNGCGDIDGLREIRIIRSNSRNSEIILNNRYINSPFSISNPVSYVKSNPITEVIVKKIIRWKEWCRWGIFVAPVKCCDGGPENKWNNYNISNECFVESYYNQGDGLNRITISSKPVINIPLPSNPLYLTDTNYLTVTIPDNIDNKYFKWKYSVGGSYPRDIPYSYNYKPILRIKGSDFLSEEDFGKNVSVWIDLKNVCSYCENPSPINFVYQKSLPILTNPNNETIFTRCYGDKADYVLHFDRPLDSDEKINFSLVPNPNSDSLINIFQLEGGNTFTLQNLPIGDYKLRITGKNGGNSFSKYGNEDFKFSIKNPSRVTFRASGINPSCPNANNGEISILAFGGTNQDYKIRLNNGEWLEFSESHMHIIKNLPQGIYTIRVKDGNDCLGGNRDNEQVSITLTAPNPITITYPSQEQKRPQFPQATNGRIMAVVQGGTPYNGANRYRFSWKRGTEEITQLATTHYDEIEDKFYISLENIPQGDYYLSKL